MKKLLITIAALAGLAAVSAGRTLQTPAGSGLKSEVDTVVPTLSIEYVFENMPSLTLDLLGKSSRLDLLDYYAVDSIADVVNSMGGRSHLVRPVTDDYIKVQITPVTTLAIKLFSYGMQQLIMTSYTIGDSLQASDSEIRFYDKDMQLLDRDKFIKLATMPDFFNFKGVDKNTQKELLDLVPFPTVEYILEPGSDKICARFTSGEFLGKETLDRITPYLQRERWYKWNGHKFKMLK